MPSEPIHPIMDPRFAQQSEFYQDLVKGFSDMVLSVYRQEHIPKLRPEEGWPGMFVLKQGPSTTKEFREARFPDIIERRDQLANEIANNELYKFDKHDVERPTAVLNVDFCVSACSDYVEPPAAPPKRMAVPNSLLDRPRRYPGVRYGRDRVPSPPPDDPPRPHPNFFRPSQEQLHAGHQCFDIERLAREFMWWFLEWRAAIPRHINYPLENAISATVQNYTSSEIQEREYKQALYNLIWEIKHPRASRYGQINPNGTPLQHPWILGDELIHSVLGLSTATEATIELRLKSMMRYAYSTRRERNIYTTLADRELWGMLTRSVAPFDDSATHDDMMRFANGKIHPVAEFEHFHREHKRRLKWDGRAEVHEPEALDAHMGKEEGGLTDEEREKLVKEIDHLKEQNKGLQKLYEDAAVAANRARSEVEELQSELDAERRTHDWVLDQGERGGHHEDLENTEGSEFADRMELDG